jgi:hypothetical protein
MHCIRATGDDGHWFFLETCKKKTPFLITDFVDTNKCNTSIINTLMMYSSILASEEMITISKAEYQQFLEQRSILSELKSENESLNHQLSELKRLIYGSRRERFIAADPLQSPLFELPSLEVHHKKQEEITYTRTKPEPAQKKHPLRAELPAHLPRKVDHLPYYRQRKIFKRQGLHIPDSTIGGWANAAIGNWLTPVYEMLKKKLLSSDYLMADETPIAVLTEDKPGATHRGYHWVYYDPVNNLVCFDYRQGRGRDGPKNFLKAFAGYLQSDGYNAYNDLGPPGKITYLACMAHARRKFEHARDNDLQRADKVLSWIGSLYDIERKKELPLCRIT